MHERSAGMSTLPMSARSSTLSPRGLDGGSIAGAVVGSVVGALIIIFCVVPFLLRARRQWRTRHGDAALQAELGQHQSPGGRFSPPQLDESKRLSVQSIMILPGQNRYLAKDYFDSLPNSDVNRQYFEGTKYQTPTNTFARLYNFLTIPQRIQTLKGFYPHQRTVVATEQEYQADWESGLTYSLGFTAASWFLLFNFARYGYVAPVLREYGWFLKTHRLFRHYLFSLVVPLALTTYSIHDKYADHMEVLWTIHANRLNKKMLEDPQSTIYPENLRDRLKLF